MPASHNLQEASHTDAKQQDLAGTKIGFQCHYSPAASKNVSVGAASSTSRASHTHYKPRIQETKQRGGANRIQTENRGLRGTAVHYSGEKSYKSDNIFISQRFRHQLVP
jgi:hypothetical protein